MRFKELLLFLLLPIYRPLTQIKRLIKNKNKVLYSTIIFLFLGVIYTISVQLAYMKGIGATVEPFLKIPAKDYYFWQRFYQIPFFFIASIVFAGTVRLISIPLKGEGVFEDVFCLLCASQTLPMFLTMWIPETFGFVFFSGRSLFPIWLDIIRQVVGIVWPLAICIIGISIIEKIRWYYSCMLTLIASIPMTLLMIIFIR